MLLRFLDLFTWQFGIKLNNKFISSPFKFLPFVHPMNVCHSLRARHQYPWYRKIEDRILLETILHIRWSWYKDCLNLKSMIKGVLNGIFLCFFSLNFFYVSDLLDFLRKLTYGHQSLFNYVCPVNKNLMSRERNITRVFADNSFFNVYSIFCAFIDFPEENDWNITNLRRSCSCTPFISAVKQGF